MKIYIGTDHAGFGLKARLVSFLEIQGHEIIDKGAYSFHEEDDYPDFVGPVAQAISDDPVGSKGIIMGATGEGEAIVANRFPNVRAVVYYGKTECVVDFEADIIIRSRQHNDSNILSLGARYFTEDEMVDTVKLWLETPFSGEERHVRRIAKIEKIRDGK